MKSYILSNRLLALALLLGLCTMITYLPALNLGFVEWDDNKYVYDNPHVVTLTGGFIRWAFTTFEGGGNWHPLTWLSLGLDRFLWGTGPMGFHATNILFHCLNTALVTILTALIISAGKSAVSGEKEGGRISDRGMMAAAVTGILFGFHPIHVESVAWISERKDVLYSFFYLAGILAYMRYARIRSNRIDRESFYRGHSSGSYFLTLLLFILSLLSKSMAVTFPVVLLILDWHPLNRFEKAEQRFSLFMEKLPFFLLSIVFSIVAIIGQSLQPLTLLPLIYRFLNGTNSLVMYLWKMLVPLNLIPFYPYPADISLHSIKYLFTFLIVSGIVVSCVVLYKKKRGHFWIAAWGFYLVTLFPVLGIIQVGRQSMADRYAYLPSLGPFLLVGLLFAHIVEKKNKALSESLSLRYAALVVLVMVMLALSSLTVRQVGIWKDGLTLWNYVIEKEPGRAHVAYNNRGSIHSDMGQLEEALRDFDAAIKINPNYQLYFSNRAYVYMRLNKFTNALQDLNTALILNPSYLSGYIDRAIIFNSYGDNNKAFEDLTTAVTIKPDFMLGYYNRGLLNLSIAQYDNAVADFSKALSLDPDSPESYFFRGKAYLKLRSTKRAEQDIEVACKMGYREACVTKRSLNGSSTE